MKSKKIEEDKSPYRSVIWMSVGVIIVWVLSALWIYNALPNWSDRGTVGDMFGAVNALFSGLAFAALIYTILLQREEIKTNRKEIELNRKELKKSTQAQIKSQQALNEQVTQSQLSSKLQAMSTMINYYNTQIANQNNAEALITLAKEKRRKLISSIDELIDGLHDSNVD